MLDYNTLVEKARTMGTEDRDECTEMIDQLADALESAMAALAAKPVEHRPDWSDWQEGDDGDSCKCGFNGTSQECATSRRLAAHDAEVRKAALEEAAQIAEARVSGVGVDCCALHRAEWRGQEYESGQVATAIRAAALGDALKGGK